MIEQDRMISLTNPRDPFIFSTADFRCIMRFVWMPSEQRKGLEKQFEGLREENWLANGFSLF